MIKKIILVLSLVFTSALFADGDKVLAEDLGDAISKVYDAVLEHDFDKAKEIILYAENNNFSGEIVSSIYYALSQPGGVSNTELYSLLERERGNLKQEYQQVSLVDVLIKADKEGFDQKLYKEMKEFVVFLNKKIDKKNIQGLNALKFSYTNNISKTKVIDRIKNSKKTNILKIAEEIRKGDYSITTKEKTEKKTERETDNTSETEVDGDNDSNEVTQTSSDETDPLTFEQAHEKAKTEIKANNFEKARKIIKESIENKILKEFSGYKITIVDETNDPLIIHAMKATYKDKNQAKVFLDFLMENSYNPNLINTILFNPYSSENIDSNLCPLDAAITFKNTEMVEALISIEDVKASGITRNLASNSDENKIKTIVLEKFPKEENTGTNEEKQNNTSDTKVSSGNDSRVVEETQTSSEEVEDAETTAVTNNEDQSNDNNKEQTQTSNNGNVFKMDIFYEVKQTIESNKDLEEKEKEIDKILSHSSKDSFFFIDNSSGYNPLMIFLAKMRRKDDLYYYAALKIIENDEVNQELFETKIKEIFWDNEITPMTFLLSKSRQKDDLYYVLAETIIQKSKDLCYLTTKQDSWGNTAADLAFSKRYFKLFDMMTKETK
jgi:hypothetical protein